MSPRSTSFSNLISQQTSVSLSSLSPARSLEGGRGRNQNQVDSSSPWSQDKAVVSGKPGEQFGPATSDQSGASRPPSQHWGEGVEPGREAKKTIYDKAEVQVTPPGSSYTRCDPEQYESRDAFYKSPGLEKHLKDLNCKLDDIKRYLDSFFPGIGHRSSMFIDAFDAFKDKVNRGEYPFTIWGSGRDNLHDVCVLLGRPDIPDSIKKEALLALFSDLDMCSEKVASKIVDAKIRLSLNGEGRFFMLEGASPDLSGEQISNTLEYANLFYGDKGSDTYLPHLAAYYGDRLEDESGLPPSGDRSADSGHDYIQRFSAAYPTIMNFVVEESFSSGSSILSPVTICNHIVRKHGDTYVQQLNEIKVRYFPDGPVRIGGPDYDRYSKDVEAEVLMPIYELLGKKAEVHELEDFRVEEGADGTDLKYLDFDDFKMKFQKLVGKAFNEDSGLNYATPAGTVNIELDEGKGRN